MSRDDGRTHRERSGETTGSRGETLGNPLFDYWYFHLPNFVLAAIFYTLLGRFALGLFVPADWDNYIWRAFVRITDPAVKLARLITPAIVPERVLLLLTAVWVLVARLAFYGIMAANDLVPRLQQGGAA